MKGPLAWVWTSCCAICVSRVRSLRHSPGFRSHCDPDAGAWHWRQHSGLQRDECGTAADRCRCADPDRLVYLRTSNPPQRNRHHRFQRRPSLTRFTMRCAVRTSGLAPIMAYVPLSGSKVAVRYGAEPEEAEGDMVSGTFFSGLGRESAAGPRLQRRGRDQSRGHCRDQLQLLDAALCARSGGTGKNAVCEWQCRSQLWASRRRALKAWKQADRPISGFRCRARPELNAWGNPPEDGKTVHFRTPPGGACG